MAFAKERLARCEVRREYITEQDLIKEVEMMSSCDDLDGTLPVSLATSY